jgi:hypothetical protein
MEIGASSSTFGPNLGGQPIVTTKSISPIRGGTSLKIIPLPIVIVVVPIEVHEHVDTSSFVVSNKLGTLKFLSITIPLTPPQIGVGLGNILISNAFHA